MTENEQSRIKVEDLPEAEKELSPEEAEAVKGGLKEPGKIDFPNVVDPSTSQGS